MMDSNSDPLNVTLFVIFCCRRLIASRRQCGWIERELRCTGKTERRCCASHRFVSSCWSSEGRRIECRLPEESIRWCEENCSFLTVPNPVVGIEKVKGAALFTVLTGEDDVGILKLVFSDGAVSAAVVGMVVLGKLMDGRKELVVDVTAVVAVVIAGAAVANGGVGRMGNEGMPGGAILFVLLVLLLLCGTAACVSGPFLSNKRSKSWRASAS